MTWVLVILVHAGMMSSKDSMALTNVSGFKSEAACLAAGIKAIDLGKMTTKDVKVVCLRQD